jgi:hypothetical protein
MVARQVGSTAQFARRIPSHLQCHARDLKHLVWQTNEGSEFIAELQKDGSPSASLAKILSTSSFSTSPRPTPMKEVAGGGKSSPGLAPSLPRLSFQL